MFHFLSIYQGLVRLPPMGRQTLAYASLIVLFFIPCELNAQASPFAETPPAGVELNVLLEPVVPAVVDEKTVPAIIDLKQVFEQAWARHPIQKALAERLTANQLALQAAESWTAQPAALAIRTQSDRVGTDQGAEELEWGVSVSLWLPGERSRARQLAFAQSQTIDADVTEARWILAGALREAWWAWQRAQVESQLASDQVRFAAALLADVTRRLVAGDLAQADQHQAAGALALAQSAQYQANFQRSKAWQALSAWVFLPENETHRLSNQPESTHELAAKIQINAHPAAQSAIQQARTAREAAALASSQLRTNPELSLGAIQSRSQRGGNIERALVMALRVPLGKAPVQMTQAIELNAKATELEAQADLVRVQVEAAISGSKQRLIEAQAQQRSALQRAHLAQETQGFFEKSFSLGETDMPTRLRIAQEAQEATRQAALAQIDVFAAISALRQAAGWLPQ